MSKLPFFLFSSLLASTSALALSCYDGSTDCIDAKQTADDCLKLGYSLNEPECEHYLLCSFNTDYKICVKEKTDGCPGNSFRTTISKCNSLGGINLANTDFGGGEACCQTCPDGYKAMTPTTASTQNLACLDGKYPNLLSGGTELQCCSACPAGASIATDQQCKAMGGTFTQKAFGDDQYCCQTCPDGYTMTNQFAGLTCNSTIYKNEKEGGTAYKCCLACPDGKMWKQDCRDGIFKDADSNGCGTCEQCPDGYEASSDKTKCVLPCQEGCPEDAKFISSADEITTDHNSYCLANSITLNNSNATIPLPGGGAQLRSLKFYSGCNVTLTVNAWMSGLVSYVNTIIDQGADVYNLELHAGGTFKVPMAPDSSSGTTKACQVKLLGGKEYLFQTPPDSSYDPKVIEYPAVVSCKKDSCPTNLAGCASGDPTLRFEATDTRGSMYNFSGCTTDSKCYLGVNVEKECCINEGNMGSLGSYGYCQVTKNCSSHSKCIKTD